MTQTRSDCYQKLREQNIVGMYPPYIDLAARLNEIVPGDFPKMTMFANSGAETVENAVKIARYATKRPAIIAFENGFHGRTFLTMSLTSKGKMLDRSRELGRTNLKASAKSGTRAPCLEWNL